MLANRRVYPTIPAADPARAKRWYEEKLGLKPSREDLAGIQYRLGEGTGFFLYPTPNAGRAPNTLMTFVTTDIVADVGALKQRGVAFEEYDFPGLKTVDSIAKLGAVRAAWFRDLEGNILAISEEPA